MYLDNHTENLIEITACAAFLYTNASERLKHIPFSTWSEVKDNILYWMEEFEEIHANTDWNETIYDLAIDEFVMRKFDMESEVIE